MVNPWSKIPTQNVLSDGVSDCLILDTKENLDRRWLRAHQYVTHSGSYRLRPTPARTLFGLMVHLLRRVFE